MNTDLSVRRSCCPAVKHHDVLNRVGGQFRNYVQESDPLTAGFNTLTAGFNPLTAGFNHRNKLIRTPERVLSVCFMTSATSIIISHCKILIYTLHMMGKNTPCEVGFFF